MGIRTDFTNNLPSVDVHATHHNDLATAANAAPKGIIAAIRGTANSNGTAVTTETMQMTLTFTAEASRTYKVHVSAAIVDNETTTANAGILIVRWAAGGSVTTSSTVLSRTQIATPASSSSNLASAVPGFDGLLTGASAGSVTVGLTLQPIDGTSAVRLLPTSTGGPVLYVEDVGVGITVNNYTLP